MRDGRIPPAGTLRRIFLFLTLVLAGVHLALAAAGPEDPRAVPFVVAGLAFLAGVAVQRTKYWRPILYLPGIGFAVYLGSVWLFGGAQNPVLGVAVGVVAVAFSALALYLFVVEEYESA